MTSSAGERAPGRFPGVRAPRAVLPPAAEGRLTERQRQVLDELEVLVAQDGLADLTMAEIAAQVNCSLRTLYGISPSKDQLVLTVVDRRLHRIGRKAIAALDATLSPLDLLRLYLRAVNEAVQPTTFAFSRDFANVPGARELIDSHEGYVIAVTQSLLDRAVSEGEIERVDTGALAHVLGGLGREFARRDLASARTAKQTADAITEIVLRGLERG